MFEHLLSSQTGNGSESYISKIMNKFFPSGTVDVDVLSWVIIGSIIIISPLASILIWFLKKRLELTPKKLIDDYYVPIIETLKGGKEESESKLKEEREKSYSSQERVKELEIKIADYVKETVQEGKEKLESELKEEKEKRYRSDERVKGLEMEAASYAKGEEAMSASLDSLITASNTIAGTIHLRKRLKDGSYETKELLLRKKSKK